MKLDTTSLANAVKRLREDLARHQREPKDEWQEWRRFREMRTRTSHTYDAKAAMQVVAAIPAFLDEAEYLCAELQRRLA